MDGERTTAQILVLPDVCAVNLKTKWCAILGGHEVVDAQALLSKGKKGCVISYIAALASRRHVFISDQFMQANPIASEVIVKKATGDGSSKWVFRIRADFLARLNASGRKTEFIAFVAVREASLGDFAGVKNLLTVKTAFGFLEKIGFSSLG